MGVDTIKILCYIPEDLHPASDVFLYDLANGKLSLESFMRLFPLPNSDYLVYLHCIAEVYQDLEGIMFF